MMTAFLATGREEEDVRLMKANVMHEPETRSSKRRRRRRHHYRQSEPFERIILKSRRNRAIWAKRFESLRLKRV
jgi:hypothetical protein